MQTIGNGGCITQMMVVVKLQQVRFAVRTVQVNVTLLLAYERLVTHGMEQFPGGNHVLYHADV